MARMSYGSDMISDGVVVVMSSAIVVRHYVDGIIGVVVGTKKKLVVDLWVSVQ
jgi:hypothetical protein